MGHNSPEGFFLGQELLLDFAVWIDQTSNADNTIMVYQLRVSGKLRLKTQDLRPKTQKTKTLFFLGEIIKFQLSLPLSGKMNEINALTLTNDNLVVFLFPCMANETISGCRGVAFSLCTKVWRHEAKQCFVYFAKR